MRTDPIIFVIGCTGTGKSDLGVAIAKKFGGEVISVDSMQFYRGLDIATNKITAEEADGVPHHMMSFLDPSSSAASYNVHQFRETTLRLVDEIRKRSRIPILVGGTTYYAESILYENNLIETTMTRTSSESEDDVDDGREEEEEEEEDVRSNQEIWEELRSVDEKSAMILHPNNRFRVKRALQIFKETGVPKSALITRQKCSEHVDLGGRLRFADSLVIYMDASPTVLDARLDARVDKMLRIGLKTELREFYDQHKVGESRYGVMQCIGLKEFLPWLRMSPDEQETEKGAELFRKGCEDVKLHTRQYARRQRRWYVQRLLKRADGERKMASTKMLDTSDKETIIRNGLEIVDQWMRGRDLFEEISTDSTLKGEDANILLRCDVCGIQMTGKSAWEKHVVGKKHKHHLKLAKNAENR